MSKRLWILRLRSPVPAAQARAGLALSAVLRASFGLLFLGLAACGTTANPEFSYEANPDNLKQAVIDLDIPYAVAQDNDRKTWGTYKNRYLPTLYLIDKRGHIRYIHIGEGAHEITEAAIQELLAENYP